MENKTPKSEYYAQKIQHNHNKHGYIVFQFFPVSGQCRKIKPKTYFRKLLKMPKNYTKINLDSKNT